MVINLQCSDQWITAVMVNECEAGNWMLLYIVWYQYVEWWEKSVSILLLFTCDTLGEVHSCHDTHREGHVDWQELAFSLSACLHLRCSRAAKELLSRSEGSGRGRFNTSWNKTGQNTHAHVVVPYWFICDWLIIYGSDKHISYYQCG